MKNSIDKKKAKSIRKGLRLDAPAPKIIKSKKEYSRKKKKRVLTEESEMS